MKSILTILARAIARTVLDDIGKGILTHEKERRLKEFLASH